MFTALRYRNFRLLWLGLIVSFTGSFMQTAAILWHVSLLVPPDRKGMALGLVGLVRAVPVITFSMIAGVAADVFDRRKLMLVTQIAGTSVAGLLSILAFIGLSSVWPIYVLAALSSVAGAFDPPARHSIMPTLVPREHLANAVSLNSAMIQTASVVGPAASGLLIARAGVGWAYAANGLSFLFVVFALLAMGPLPPRDGSSEHARDDFSVAAARKGLQWVFRQPIIRSTMLLDFFATFFASAMALLPIYAQDILHVGASGYGLLAAAPAAGAVATLIVMLRLMPRVIRQGEMLLWAVVGYGLSTVAFGFSTSFGVAFAALLLSGASDAVSMVVRNLVRQLETPDAMRGRMTGVNMMFFQGGPQLGELEAGLVAQWLGPRVSVVSGGFGCVAATAIVAAVTPELRAYRPRLKLPEDDR